MKMTIEMPQVRRCNVNECAYNREQACHARAITIGDSTVPMCDTFFQSSTHAMARNIAGVGSCKVSSCSHNQDFECNAENINVDHSEAKILCMTFERR